METSQKHWCYERNHVSKEVAGFHFVPSTHCNRVFSQTQAPFKTLKLARHTDPSIRWLFYCCRGGHKFLTCKNRFTAWNNLGPIKIFSVERSGKKKGRLFLLSRFIDGRTKELAAPEKLFGRATRCGTYIVFHVSVLQLSHFWTNLTSHKVFPIFKCIFPPKSCLKLALWPIQ